MYAAGMDKTCFTYVDDECFDMYDYDDDTDDDTNDDADGDSDDGGRGNLYTTKAQRSRLKDQGTRLKAQGSRIKDLALPRMSILEEIQT